MSPFIVALCSLGTEAGPLTKVRPGADHPAILAYGCAVPLKMTEFDARADCKPEIRAAEETSMQWLLTRVQVHSPRDSMYSSIRIQLHIPRTSTYRSVRGPVHSSWAYGVVGGVLLLAVAPVPGPLASGPPTPSGRPSRSPAWFRVSTP